MADRALQNFVNGKYIDASDGRTSDVIDPSTGEIYAQAPVSGRQDVDAAMQAAAAAFEGWRDTTPSERSLAMFRIADAMEKRADDIVAAETRNTGKPVALTASEEVPPAVDQIRFFAGAARVLEGRSAGEYMKEHTSMIRREPIGVCAQATPWNDPMMMAVWKFGPDIEATAEGIAGAGYFNAGQDCTAATRVLAGPGVAADLTAALAEQASNTKTGGLDVPDAYFGPLNNPNQLARVEGFLQRVPDHAHVVSGGHRVGQRGSLFEPTVVSDLQQHDEMIKAEIL